MILKKGTIIGLGILAVVVVLVIGVVGWGFSAYNNLVAADENVQAKASNIDADLTRTGLVPRYPTMIVSVTLALFALLSFLIGVVLDVIVKKHRQLYELFLNLLQEGEHDKDA